MNISLEKVIVSVKIMLSKHKKSTINSCVTHISRYIAHSHTHAGTSTRLYKSYIENHSNSRCKIAPLTVSQETHSVSKDLMRCAQHCNFVLEQRFLLHKASIPHCTSTVFFHIFTLLSLPRIKPGAKPNI